MRPDLARRTISSKFAQFTNEIESSPIKVQLDKFTNRIWFGCHRCFMGYFEIWIKIASGNTFAGYEWSCMRESFISIIYLFFIYFFYSSGFQPWQREPHFISVRILIFTIKITTACQHSCKHFGDSLNNHNSHLWNVYRGLGQYIRATIPVL